MSRQPIETEQPRRSWALLFELAGAFLVGIGVRFYALPLIGSKLGDLATTAVVALACLFLGYAAAYLSLRFGRREQLKALRSDYEALHARSVQLLANAERLDARQ